MSDHCVRSHRTYYLLHFNFRAASRTVAFEMGPSVSDMSDHYVHSHRTYYLLHFNFRAASTTVTFEMGPSILSPTNSEWSNRMAARLKE